MGATTALTVVARIGCQAPDLPNTAVMSRGTGARTRAPTQRKAYRDSGHVGEEEMSYARLSAASAAMPPCWATRGSLGPDATRAGSSRESQMRGDRFLKDYQTQIEWLGEPVLTLEDLWPKQPRAMIVGLNPAPSSVEVGHNYQGRSGQRQLLRLADAGLFRRPEMGSTYFEPAALEAGVGFTDVVKRPTRGEKDVNSKEIEFGRGVLNVELGARGVPLVICVFRHPVTALLGTSGAPGFQDRTTTWGARVFRMPGPFAAAAEVEDVMAKLSEAIANE